jgi:acetylserotonin N-methyltransferase
MRFADTPGSDPTLVLDLIEAFRRSKTMFTALSIGVFDRLHEGPSDAKSLSAEFLTDLPALTRLLDGCVGLGLLSREDSLYANSPTAERYLCRQSPDSLAGYVAYSNRSLYPLWADLEGAVRQGTHRWTATFGPQASLFDHYFRTDESRREFLDGMHGFGRITSPEVVRVFNLNRFQRLADLGGATGHLAIAACERYGRMSAVVFDLPVVLPHATPHVEASSARDRITLQAGDFFSDPLPPADLYALGRIFHDWTDDKIRLLLRKMHDALPPGGGVLLAETLLDDDKRGPVHALMQSLNMLVCTEGRERTFDEYRALFEEAGFGDVEARRTGTPLDAVLALKKQ